MCDLTNPNCDIDNNGAWQAGTDATADGYGGYDLDADWRENKYVFALEVASHLDALSDGDKSEQI